MVPISSSNASRGRRYGISERLRRTGCAGPARNRAARNRHGFRATSSGTHRASATGAIAAAERALITKALPGGLHECTLLN